MQSRERRRRGAVLLIALAVLGFVALASVSVAVSLRQQREAQQDAQRRLQVQQLVAAGHARAAARLAADPKYPGETWKLSAEEMASPVLEQATIEIQIVRLPEGRGHINVQASWPAGSLHEVGATEQRPLPEARP